MLHFIDQQYRFAPCARLALGAFDQTFPESGQSCFQSVRRRIDRTVSIMGRQFEQ